MADDDQIPAEPRDVYLKFYPSDWRGDEHLAMCSLAARGLWVELMCLAHRAGGYVRVNGRAPTLSELAQIVRAKPSEVGKLLAELTRNSVCSVADDGALVSRRMVRDATKRAINRANGLRGGHPVLVKSVNRKRSDGLTESVKPHSYSHSYSQIPEKTKIKTVSPEPAEIAVSTPAVLTFPIVGTGAETWPLTEAQVRLWTGCYPGLDVVGECRKAGAWIGAHPERRKTGKGMARFLVAWLNRANDSKARPQLVAGGSQGKGDRSKDAMAQAILQRAIARGEVQR